MNKKPLQETEAVFLCLADESLTVANLFAITNTALWYVDIFYYKEEYFFCSIYLAAYHRSFKNSKRVDASINIFASRCAKPISTSIYPYYSGVSQASSHVP